MIRKVGNGLGSASQTGTGTPLTYSFQSDLFVWSGGQANWFFVRVPRAQSEDLKEQMEGLTNGFGSIRVEATIEQSIFRTSVFPESATKCYLLPVKKQVRRAAEIEEGDLVEVSITVLQNE